MNDINMNDINMNDKEQIRSNELEQIHLNELEQILLYEFLDIIGEYWYSLSTFSTGKEKYEKAKKLMVIPEIVEKYEELREYLIYKIKE